MQRFQGGLVFKAHRLLYHSTLGSRVVKKKKEKVEVILVVVKLVGKHTSLKCVKETEIPIEQQPQQGVFVCDHAGLVINEFSRVSMNWADPTEQVESEDMFQLLNNQVPKATDDDEDLGPVWGARSACTLVS